MEIGPEGVQSISETEVTRKLRPIHYIAAVAFLAIGYAVGWLLASLQMYSNWERGIAPEANAYYAIVGVLFILLGCSSLIRSSSLTKRIIAVGVFGLVLGAVVQYVQLGTAYIDFWWWTFAPRDLAAWR
jgi:hypothetical protein